MVDKAGQNQPCIHAPPVPCLHCHLCLIHPVPTSRTNPANALSGRRRSYFLGRGLILSKLTLLGPTMTNSVFFLEWGRGGVCYLVFTYACYQYNFLKLYSFSCSFPNAFKLFFQTYTGNILIAVNPFQRLPHLYNNHMMGIYKGAEFGELGPHPFAIADRSYRWVFLLSHIMVPYYMSHIYGSYSSAPLVSCLDL